MIVVRLRAERRGGGNRIRLTARCDLSMKHTLLTAVAVAVCLGFVATIAQDAGRGGQQPGAAQSGAGGLGPGQIRPRPAEGRAPEFPPPNIRDYKPRSTLVV